MKKSASCNKFPSLNPIKSIIFYLLAVNQLPHRPPRLFIHFMKNLKGTTLDFVLKFQENRILYRKTDFLDIYDNDSKVRVGQPGKLG